MEVALMETIDNDYGEHILCITISAHAQLCIKCECFLQQNV